MLLILTRGIAAPLADNAANNSLKELLRTAEITEKRERVTITATLSPALFSSPAGSENAPEGEPTGGGGPK